MQPCHSPPPWRSSFSLSWPTTSIYSVSLYLYTCLIHWVHPSSLPWVVLLIWSEKSHWLTWADSYISLEMTLNKTPEFWISRFSSEIRQISGGLVSLFGLVRRFKTKKNFLMIKRNMSCFEERYLGISRDSRIDTIQFQRYIKDLEAFHHHNNMHLTCTSHASNQGFRLYKQRVCCRNIFIRINYTTGSPKTVSYSRWAPCNWEARIVFPLYHPTK